MHPCSLISAFVDRVLENILSRRTSGEILIFLLVSVAEQVGFESHFVGNSENRVTLVAAHIIDDCRPAHTILVFSTCTHEPSLVSPIR